MARESTEFKLRDGVLYLVKSEFIEVADLTADSVTITESDVADEGRLCFGDDDDFCIRYDSPSDRLVIEDGNTNENLAELTKDGLFEFDESRSQRKQTVRNILPAGESTTIKSDESMVVAECYTVDGTVCVEDGGILEVI